MSHSLFPCNHDPVYRYRRRPLALRKLTDYIRKTPFLELVQDCPDALSAMQVLGEKTVDLMFVDINMPDLNGIGTS